MIRAQFVRMTMLGISTMFSLQAIHSARPAEAAPETVSASTSAMTTQMPVSKAVSIKSLEKQETITISVTEEGKESKYTGVPVRVLLAEMLPEFKLDVMPEWKRLTRQELVMEVVGDDGYAGLVTATDLAINKAGDRFLLATQKDGVAVKSGVQLICKMDEARVRWIRGVVSLRLLSVAKK